MYFYLVSIDISDSQIMNTNVRIYLVYEICLGLVYPRLHFQKMLLSAHACIDVFHHVITLIPFNLPIIPPCPPLAGITSSMPSTAWLLIKLLMS